jgi:hypothetical protein
MTRPFYAASLALATMLVLGGGAEASAQWVRGWRGGGIVVRAPYVGAIRVGVGVPGVIVGRPILPRRRLLPPPVIVAPPVVVAGGYSARAAEAPRYQPGAAIAPTDSRPFYTPEQLANLDDSALLNATLDALNRLDADVARFDTGDTWQAYFRIPQEAFPPPSAENRVELGLAAIEALLARFDAIAADSAYPMISGLTSFSAARAALTEVVARFGAAAARGGSTPAEPASEELPTPPPALSPAESADAGERSILSR